jgi:DNA-binding response OmpR family regulator
MKARILIVDDERNLRVTLAEILASRGYEIL